MSGRDLSEKVQKAIQCSEDLSFSVDGVLDRFPEFPFKWFVDNNIILTVKGVVEFLKQLYGKELVSGAKIRQLTPEISENSEIQSEFEERLEKEGYPRSVFRAKPGIGQRGTIRPRYFTRAEGKLLAKLA